MIGCLRTCAGKQPDIALYFEFENVRKLISSGVENSIRLKWVNTRIQCAHLLMAIAATSFIGTSGAPQYGKKDVAYLAKVRQIMAIEDVRMTIVDVHTNMKAGMDPSASLM